MTDAMALQLEIVLRQGAFVMDVSWHGPLNVLGLFGPSGSGKTTVLEVVAGLRPCARGRIVVGSRVLIDTGTGQWLPPRARGIGYVPQDAALFPHLSVRRNVMYGAGRGVAPAPVDAVMAMLEVAELLDRGVAALSGGERQRVALARALLSAPSLLLLDEPLSAVDVPRRRRIMARLGSWMAERRVPAIHVSHDATELESADHVLVLSEGRLVADGPPRDVLRFATETQSSQSQ